MLARKIGFAVLAAVVAAVLGFAAWIFASDGGPAWLAAASFGLLAALLIAFVVVVLPPGRRQLETLPGGAVGVRNSRAVTTLFLLFGAAFYLLVLGFAVIWISTGARPVDAVGPTILLLVTAVAAAPFVIALARGRYRLGGLRVTPEAVTYASYRREHSIAWTEVSAIETGPQAGELRVLGADGRTLSVPCGLLRISPAALGEFLELYRRRPRLRPELADERARERFGTPQ